MSNESKFLYLFSLPNGNSLYQNDFGKYVLLKTRFSTVNAVCWFIKTGLKLNIFQNTRLYSFS